MFFEMLFIIGYVLITFFVYPRAKGELELVCKKKTPLVPGLATSPPMIPLPIPGQFSF